MAENHGYARLRLAWQYKRTATAQAVAAALTIAAAHIVPDGWKAERIFIVSQSDGFSLFLDLHPEVERA